MGVQSMSDNGGGDNSNKSEPGAAAKWLLPIAVFLLALYVVILSVLFFTADDKDVSENIWGRYTYLLGGLEAIVFTAVGWLFGREVNRKQAEQAEKATEEAAQAKKKGEGLKQAILTHPSVAGNGQESPSNDVAALYLAARSTEF
jgi:cytochrome bd-type quinol oxidase subunit 1